MENDLRKCHKDKNTSNRTTIPSMGKARSWWCYDITSHKGIQFEWLEIDSGVYPSLHPNYQHEIPIC